MTHAPVRPTHLDLGPDYTAQEQAALDAILALGITLDPTPLPRPTEGSHVMCAFHILDAHGEDLDGGEASALLSYLRNGYLPGATTIRPVT